MTLDQALSVALVALAVGLFVWDRIRYDLVALIALAVGVAVGVIPAAEAFAGFGDPVVVVVAGALIVSAAISRSGVVERPLRFVTAHLQSTGSQVGVMVAAVTILSAVMKNIGALAIFIPVALQMARQRGCPPSCLLMPMAFGSLLGGLMTLIGTSPNILVSRMRAELLGKPFAMFDFLPVGLGIAACGVAFLAFGWRLLPKDRKGRSTAEEQFRIQDYLTEARVSAGSQMVGRTVGDLERSSGGAASVAALIRDGHRYIAAGHWKLLADDVLVLECDPHALGKLLMQAGLELEEKPPGADQPQDEVVIVEAVVTPASAMVGQPLTAFPLREHFGLAALALSRGGRRYVSRLSEMELAVGDVLLVQGPEAALPGSLEALGCLPLANRKLDLQRRTGWLPAIILAAALLLVTLEVVPVAIGFFGAALLMVLTNCLSIRQAYEAIDWPIVVMLAALIPISDAVQATGASDLIAGALAAAAASVAPQLAVGLVMIAAMALTPFLNNAATVLVMAPIAAGLARKLGLNPDPFLMATAIGAACDFLTPIGHQCNTLVMGPGGYRFGDYLRLGLPLSLIVLAVGVPLVLLVWPV